MTTAVRSKLYREKEKLVEAGRLYGVDEAVEIIQNYPEGKFDATISLNLQLSVDTKQPDGMLRSSVTLPNGSGKEVRIICFVKGEQAKDAEAAGAIEVGSDDLIEKVQKGFTDFDVVVSHPDMMRDVSKLGRVLGPKGLMPSPKTGTVSMDVGKACSELMKGKIEIRSDKTGGLHIGCGKRSFTQEALVENIRTVYKTVLDIKPASAKGDYIKNVYISVTHGPGMKIQISSLLK